MKTFHQTIFFDFVPVPLNKNAESTDKFKKFFLTFQWHQILMMSHLELIYSKNSSNSLPVNVCFFKKWKIGLVASVFQVKWEPSLVLKQSCVFNPVFIALFYRFYRKRTLYTVFSVLISYHEVVKLWSL